MTVETCHRCRAVTDTDEDHRCPHGEYCQMLDGNTGDCRSYCHVCDDELRYAEVHALMVERDALKAEVKRLRSSSALDKQLAVKEGEAPMTRTAVELTTDVIGICEEMTRDSKRGVGVRALGEKYAPRMVAVDREAATLDAEVAALRARVAELEAPRSPSALELAEAWAECAYNPQDDGGVADSLRAELAAYDKRK